MGLRRFIIRRLVEIIVIFFVIMTVLFVLFRLAPGDPVSRMVDPSMTPEDAQLLMESMGLDQSVWTQYLYYLKNMAIR
jgi:peptide/nickel transport system permease protein